MIEKLQTKLVEATELVRDFEFELAQAKDHLEKVQNNATASAVSIAEIKLAAATRALNKAKAELDHEKERLKSGDYKAAQKRLAAIDKEGENLRDIVLARIDDLYAAISDLDDLAKEQYRLNKGYRIGAIPLDQKQDYRQLLLLQSHLIKWRKNWKARKIGNPPATPIKQEYTKEQARAMKERYKPATELNAMLARQWAKEHPGDDDLD